MDEAPGQIFSSFDFGVGTISNCEAARNEFRLELEEWQHTYAWQNPRMENVVSFVSGVIVISLLQF